MDLSTYVYGRHDLKPGSFGRVLHRPLPFQSWPSLDHSSFWQSSVSGDATADSDSVDITKPQDHAINPQMPIIQRHVWKSYILHNFCYFVNLD